MTNGDQERALQELVAAYGTDPARWPDDDPRRKAALAALEAQQDTAAFSAAARLDLRLNAVAARPKPSDELLSKLMDVPETHPSPISKPTSIETGGGGDLSGNFLSRFFSPVGLGAQAASMAAVTIIGLWLGALSQVSGDGDSKMIDLTEMVWSDNSFMPEEES